MLAQGLADLGQPGYEADWSGLFAGLTIAMLPVLGSTWSSSGRSRPA